MLLQEFRSTEAGVAMIGGIGIDVCEISRMRKAVSRQGFCSRVFSHEEITYAQEKADPAAHFAAAFAAREALSKATGWGIAGLGINSCSVERTSSGPRFVFDEKTLAKLSSDGIESVFLSISHEAGIAVAVVILEKK